LRSHIQREKEGKGDEVGLRIRVDAVAGVGVDVGL
jgi:hypothetical protein